MNIVRKQQLFITLLLLLLPSFMQAGQKVKWTFSTGGPVYSSPAYNNGKVYIGSDDFNLYCLSANSGKQEWKFKSGGIIRCKPAIENNAVFFSSDDGNLYSLNAKTGVKNWELNIGNRIKRVLPSTTVGSGNYWDYMQSSPCINNGVVYVGSGDSCLYAVEAATGKLKWKVKTEGLIRSSPCIYKDYVYVGSWDGYIYAFNKINGSKKWAFDTRGNQYKNVQPSPKVSNGILYCGSRNPYFYAINVKTGKEIWKYSYKFSWVESSATIIHNVVYVGSSDLHTVHAFNANTGKVIWKCAVPGDAWSSPFYYNGIIYIGLGNYTRNYNTKVGGAILAINASTGKLKWQLDCGKTPFISGVVSSPVVNNNTVYYGSLDGKVYAVSTELISAENNR